VDAKPVTTGDVRTDPRFHRPDLAHAQDWAGALVVPLMASKDREPIGAFSVYSIASDPGRLAESEWDEKVLTCLAHYAALAVHNAARQDALRAAQERHAVAETFAVVGDIAANLLHHLNNKVGTIPVRVQGIQDKCESALLADLYLAANLEEIERSAREAMDAVRQNLVHLHPIHLAPLRVATCVAAAIEAADLPTDVQIRTLELDDLPAVVAGQRSLTLVFSNLLENAAAAMKGRGAITILGATHDGWVEVEVSDSGPGIAPVLHDRIFEFSFSGRASARAGKLGFGLWWVKTLMVRLGGSVSVESDGCHGTTFRLRLPCAEQGI
jgi:signal transduction histidine kinase